MMNKMPSKNIILAIVFLANTCGLGTLNAASAQQESVTPLPATTQNPDHSVEPDLTTGQPPPFVYSRERPDPFFPFLTQEIMKAEANIELPGTQKFEPSQLSLVAIVSGKRGFMAMVQDSAGIGYVLRKGTKVGETGAVTQITPDKVIIEQSLKNVTGERISRKIEMILSKEGEK